MRVVVVMFAVGGEFRQAITTDGEGVAELPLP
jgi:hypothetical protein